MVENFESAFNARYSHLTRKILGLLSRNSRITISEMSRELNVSRRTIQLRLKRIEAEFGIKYTLELDEEKLGISSKHLIFVKFRKAFNSSEVQRLLLKSGIVQFAAALKGRYQLMIYAASQSPWAYANWDRNMRRSLLLPFNAYWETSEVDFRHFGFFPLRNSLLEKVKIPERHRAMLLLLNENSRMSFTELSKRLGVKYKTVVYNFQALVRLGIISRFTICMQRHEQISLMCLFSKYIPPKNYEEARRLTKLLLTSDEPSPLVSRYLINASLIGSFDFFAMGTFDSFNAGYRNLVINYKRAFRRFNTIRLGYGEVTEVMVGNLPVRSLPAKNDYKEAGIAGED
ncbi:MAG: AsnC family transcriptional regulator [Candidatus Micrarchaeota archaeon]|nr:AsnC family transcriptional regulator [Candidatus Micrarchaeota archaeon]